MKTRVSLKYPVSHCSSANRVSQQDDIDVGLSNHQITYCTRKIVRIKRGTHTARKMKFSIKDLVTFTEEILSRKLHLLCSGTSTLDVIHYSH